MIKPYNHGDTKSVFLKINTSTESIEKNTCSKCLKLYRNCLCPLIHFLCISLLNSSVSFWRSTLIVGVISSCLFFRCLRSNSKRKSKHYRFVIKYVENKRQNMNNFVCHQPGALGLLSWFFPELAIMLIGNSSNFICKLLSLNLKQMIH